MPVTGSNAGSAVSAQVANTNYNQGAASPFAGVNTQFATPSGLAAYQNAQYNALNQSALAAPGTTQMLSNGQIVNSITGNPIGIGPTYVQTPAGMVTIPAASSSVGQAYQNLALFGVGTPGVLTGSGGYATNPVTGQQEYTPLLLAQNPAYQAAANQFIGAAAASSDQKLAYPSDYEFGKQINALPTRAAQEAFLVRNDDPRAVMSWMQRYGNEPTVTGADVGKAFQSSAVFSPISTFGDTKSQSRISELVKSGYDPIAATALALEEQRQGSTGRAQAYYAGEEARAAGLGIQLPASASAVMGRGWKPYAGNPFEPSGDTYYELLQGYPSKGAISPLSGTTPLPTQGGIPTGLQVFGWNNAIAESRGKVAEPLVGTYTPAINLAASRYGQIYQGIGVTGPFGDYERLSGIEYKPGLSFAENGQIRIEPTALSPAGTGTVFIPVTGMVAPGGAGSTASPSPATPSNIASNLPLPYISSVTENKAPTGEILGARVPIASDVLAYFSPGERVTTQYSKQAIPEVTTLKATNYALDANGNVVETKTYETTGGTTTKALMTRASTPSAYDELQRSIGNLIPLTAEQGETGVRYASIFSPLAGGGKVLGNTIVESAINAGYLPYTSKEQFEYGRTYTEPLKGQFTEFKERPLSTGASYVLAAFGGTGLGIATKAYDIGKASAVERLIPYGQTARAADVFGTTVMKSVPYVLGGLFTADVAAQGTQGFTSFTPSSLEKTRAIATQEGGGAILGFEAPTTIYNAARLSDIGYKSALQEGLTSGRLDYYVKQPATAPYNLAKIDYKSYVQETGNNGILNYAIEKAGLNKVPTPEYNRPLAAPENEFATNYVYQKLPAKETPIAPEYNRPYLSQDIANAMDYVYKPAAIVEKPIVPEYVRPTVAPENEFATGYVYGTPEPLSIKIKSYLQENKPFENLKINLIRPTAEIEQYNAVNRGLTESYASVADAMRQPTTPLGKTFKDIKTPYPTPSPKAYTVESPSGTGLVTVSSVEASQVPVQTQVGTQKGYMPEYPTLAPPTQKRQSVVEEETQYLTLPPGTVSPAPKKTITYNVNPLSGGVSAASALAAIEAVQPVSASSVIWGSTVAPLSFPGLSPETTARTLAGQRSETYPFSDTSMRNSSDIFTRNIPDIGMTTTQIPQQQKTTTPYPPTSKITTFGFPSGYPDIFGGGGAGFGTRGKRAFREIFNIGLDLSTFGFGSTITPRGKRKRRKRSK